MQLFACIKFASPVIFRCFHVKSTVTYYAFPSLVAVEQLTEMPYSESVDASSCLYFDPPGLMVISF